jgi:hypothetical protein
MRYLIADLGHLGDENLDFIQHAVCYRGKLVERMVESRERDTLVQIARHDAPNECIDVRDVPLNADTQDCTDGQAQGDR